MYMYIHTYRETTYICTHTRKACVHPCDPRSVMEWPGVGRGFNAVARLRSAVGVGNLTNLETFLFC